MMLLNLNIVLNMIPAAFNPDSRIAGGSSSNTWAACAAALVLSPFNSESLSSSLFAPLQWFSKPLGCCCDSYTMELRFLVAFKWRDMNFTAAPSTSDFCSLGNHH
jgi:hypothetical protein